MLGAKSATFIRALSLASRRAMSSQGNLIRFGPFEVTKQVRERVPYIAAQAVARIGGLSALVDGFLIMRGTLEKASSMAFLNGLLQPQSLDASILDGRLLSRTSVRLETKCSLI